MPCMPRWPVSLSWKPPPASAGGANGVCAERAPCKDASAEVQAPLKCRRFVRFFDEQPLSSETVSIMKEKKARYAWKGGKKIHLRTDSSSSDHKHEATSEQHPIELPEIFRSVVQDLKFIFEPNDGLSILSPAKWLNTIDSSASPKVSKTILNQLDGIR
mmetsp:Transcript_14313/g.39086  ORF Transcript_14313/g.39086 Transcript_14313/m.39086 type:complete len:159 (-) Transcript_14313:91-567(-)